LPFLDMFQKDSVRVEVCKSIMEVFIKYVCHSLFSIRTTPPVCIYTSVRLIIALVTRFLSWVRLMYFLFRHQQEPTRDPVILNALLHICKTMHDSVK